LITGYEFFSNPGFGKALLLRKQGHLDAVAETLESQLREASPSDARSNTVFQRSEQFFPSIRKEIRERGGLTNPELLQEKNPAAVGHLLDALKRFDSLDPRRVMEITFEVARLGESLSRRHKARRKLFAHRTAVALFALFALFSAFRFQYFSIFLRASFMPDSNASLPSKTSHPDEGRLASEQAAS